MKHQIIFHPLFTPYTTTRYSYMLFFITREILRSGKSDNQKYNEQPNIVVKGIKENFFYNFSNAWVIPASVRNFAAVAFTTYA